MYCKRGRGQKKRGNGKQGVKKLRESTRERSVHISAGKSRTKLAVEMG